MRPHGASHGRRALPQSAIHIPQFPLIMPKRTDIHSVLIIGAGPIIIGQACEFDYSGTQACKALKEEGYRVILINSNPATIMTDPEFADRTYLEPITPQCVEKIIVRELEEMQRLGVAASQSSALDHEPRNTQHALVAPKSDEGGTHFARHAPPLAPRPSP